MTLQQIILTLSLLSPSFLCMGMDSSDSNFAQNPMGVLIRQTTDIIATIDDIIIYNQHRANDTMIINQRCANIDTHHYLANTLKPSKVVKKTLPIRNNQQHFISPQGTHYYRPQRNPQQHCIPTYPVHTQQDLIYTVPVKSRT